MEKKVRRNFSKKVIEEVFEEQGRMCAKCGRSLMDGYEVHHIDGDASNNTRENCMLLCERCHDAEAYATKQEQLKRNIGALGALIQRTLDGQMAGTVLDKAIDALKLKLSLEKQIYGDRLLEAPVTSRIEYSKEIMEWNLKEYLRGFKDGLLKGIEFQREIDEVNLCPKKKTCLHK